MIIECLNSLNGGLGTRMCEDECWQALWHKYMPEGDIPWLRDVHSSVCRLLLEFGGVLELELDTNISPRVDEEAAGDSVVDEADLWCPPLIRGH